MKTTIIFSHTETGHILEYFTHLYKLCQWATDRQFVFIVPEGFKEFKNKSIWPSCNHISFDYIPKAESECFLKMGYWAFAWKITKIVRRKVIQYHADKVLSLFWFPLVPYGSLLLPSFTRISGIFYDVFIRDLDSLSKKAVKKNIFFYWLLAKSSRIDRCFILNDESVSEILNKRYNTDKFVYLPDPYVPIKSFDEFDFRKKYNIPKSALVFIHFGGLAKRKGTINILKAIKSLTQDERNRFYFVFAGVVYSDIYNEFYSFVNELKCSAHIIVEDRFCSYGFLAEICRACDAILIPYLYTNRSSGLLGYSSQFGKPLLAPSNGLIGELVNKYHLGITDKIDTPEGIVKIVERFLSEKVDKPSFDYCENNCEEKFGDTIKKSLVD